MKWIPFIILWLPLVLFSQKTQEMLSAKRVTVGQTFTLNLSVSYSLDSNFSFVAPKDSLVCSRETSSNESIQAGAILRIIDFQDTSICDNRSCRWEGVFSLIALDTGNITLPTLPYLLTGQPHYFKPLTLQSSFVPEKSDIQIYDIYERFRTFPESPSNGIGQGVFFVLLATLLLIISAFIIWYFLRKNRKNLSAKPKSLLEQALLKIDTLEEKKLWITHEKEHYSELSSILKWFLSQLYGIHLLERTTTETMLLLRGKKLSKSKLQEVHELLDASDYVKFAKKSFREEDHLILTQRLRSFVLENCPTPENHD